MKPQLTRERAKELCSHFEDFSVVTRSDQGLALHDKNREYLFGKWLEPEGNSKELFILANQRLSHFFKNLDGTDTQSWLSKQEHHAHYMFHLLGESQQKGFEQFERLIGKLRHQYAFNQCTTLIQLVHEYDHVLLERQLLRLAYQEGKLAVDLRDWNQAQDLLSIIHDNNEAPVELQVKSLMQHGIALAGLKEFNPARKLLNEALELIDQYSELRPLRHQVLLELAIVMRDCSNEHSDQVKTLLETSIIFAREHGDLPCVATALNTIATLHLKHRHIAEAIKDLQESLTVLKQSGDRSQQSAVYNNLGLAEMENRKWESASNYFNQALEIEKIAGHLRGQAFCLANLTRAYFNLERTQYAVETGARACELFITLKDWDKVAICRRQMACIYRRLGDLTASASAFEDAIKFYDQANDSKGAARTREELSKLGKSDGGSGCGIVLGLIILLTIIFFIVIEIGL